MAPKRRAHWLSTKTVCMRFENKAATTQTGTNWIICLMKCVGTADDAFLICTSLAETETASGSGAYKSDRVELSATHTLTALVLANGNVSAALRNAELGIKEGGYKEKILEGSCLRKSGEQKPIICL